MAWRRPSSVRGRSVVPVCRPLRLHSVSPCRASTTDCATGLLSAGPDVAVRGAAADLDVEAGRRGRIPGARLLQVPADGGVVPAVDAQPAGAATHRHAALHAGRG